MGFSRVGRVSIAALVVLRRRRACLLVLAC